MKLGVILSRCQPLHKGHVDMINKALKENDKVLFIIGSANKYSTIRNPFNINMRIKMYKSALKLITNPDRLEYMFLSDLSIDEKIPKQDNISKLTDTINVNNEWGLYLYYNIVAKTGEKTFSFYYNDDTSLVLDWFPEYIRNRITIISSYRIDNISSSEIRQAILNNDNDYIKKCIPYYKDKDIEVLKDKYKEITEKGE